MSFSLKQLGSSYEHRLHHRTPGIGQIIQIVTASPQGQQPTSAMAVSQVTEPGGGMAMGLAAEGQMGDRIAGDTIGTALQQNELRLRFFYKALHLLPCLQEELIIRPRWQRDIELGPFRLTCASLLHRACSRVEKTAILMQIDENQIRITLESIEDAITMVGINVHIGDTSDPMYLTQGFDGDAAVVEDTETGRPITPGMMQAGNWHEGPPGLSSQQVGNRLQYRTNHPGRGLVDTRKGRCITIVEVTLSGCGERFHPLHIGRRMKSFNCTPLRQHRGRQMATLIQATLPELLKKGIMPGRAKWVIRAEVIVPQLPTRIN